MEWIALVFSGFVATLVAISFFWVTRSFHWTSFSPTIFVGCLLLPDPRRPHTETLGYLILLLLGSTLAPILFRTILVAADAVGWLGGVAVGGVMGLLLAGLIPMIGTISACVKAGSIPQPGRFGTGWGQATPAIIVLGSILFGATFAAIYAGF